MSQASRTAASPVTYSPAYTLVPTYECFNRCSYCNFRVDPGQDRWLTLEAAASRLRALRSQGIIEILLLSGEVHPEHPRRAAWFERIYQLCELALELGFLPHTNAGPLSYRELAQLRQVNVSMGLMLEQITPSLLETVHRHAPSKRPALRLEQLEWAGQLQIPFTTGLLLGLGETQADRIATLTAIAQTHQRWGQIQEVILQPHSPGQQQAWLGAAFPMDDFVALIQTARQILPAGIALQIPPNLIPSSPTLLACLEAGATDLGGIGPKDEVNPSYPHPQNRQLLYWLSGSRFLLQPRLPIYPQYDPWLPPGLQAAVRQWRERLLHRS
ncbi:MAG: 7,8-didemethyl-8-hydroxy-5-deazariboflavin synthase subunit CofG [Pegethrix bostrychoides GSE-TBD4-15B]|jgi:FO synthase subunit 1|uniref:7,8-didemethyl-8-hydroxy-5-deazariboflavin synthase n=1 Tax=Pegethrix bostrychoides GSE-TBD4-15B TaxID=2839662 RepID=A0A951PA80_9CYAN|nr:7,8-didemethyl-8-hydroxy-5-deazariboflavin synthase subunit CofG [Pegethrix bostrychoides GSE-TBD4-15B]